MKQKRMTSNCKQRPSSGIVGICPYCGQYGGILNRRNKPKHKRYICLCLNLNCPVQPKTKGSATIDEAIQKWNQRKDYSERNPIGYRQ